MVEQHIKIGEGGRVIIPASFRKALSLHLGDEVIVRLQDGELRIFKQAQALANLRKAMKKITKKGVNQTDAFLEFRKQDSD